MSDGTQTATIETDLPARIDRLPWARWHWMVVIGVYVAGQEEHQR